jgi:hypothetical protein
LWRFNLLNILSDYQVHIITGRSSRPEASNPLYTTWCAENDVLCSVIASSIGNLYHVLDTSTRDAAKHYARLCERFAPNNLESQYRTVSAFFELKLVSATQSAWDTYEADYNKYVSEIEKSDSSLSDLFTLKNLVALPEALHDIRTSALVCGLDQLALPKRSALMDLIKSSIWSRDDGRSTALVASDSKQSRSNLSRPTLKPKDRLCFACQGPHNIRLCTNMAKKNAYNKAVKDLRECRKHTSKEVQFD